MSIRGHWIMHQPGRFLRHISIVVDQAMRLPVSLSFVLIFVQIDPFIRSKGLVLHGTAGGGTIEWFQNPSSKVSAHYVVGQDGSVTQMVSEDDTAWHNGIHQVLLRLFSCSYSRDLGVITSNSMFNGRANPNLWCIGIEFSRNVQNNNPMPEVQIAAGVRLVADIKRRYKGINIYTHDQFSVGRTCPGPSFPLARFTNA